MARSEMPIGSYVTAADVIERCIALGDLSWPIVKIPSAPIAAAGLIGGYLVARQTKKRPLGGAVLAAAGIAAGRKWLRPAGPVGTALLSAIYLGGFGASHPLAKKIGAWPAVLTAAAASGVASWALADRRATR